MMNMKVLFLGFWTPLLETSNVVLGTSFDVQSSNIEILQNMIVYPSDLGEWIFGKGESIFGISGQNSDIGYIIQLNYGGIIYCILLAFFFFLIVYRLFKMGIKKEWYFFVVTYSDITAQL